MTVDPWTLLEGEDTDETMMAAKNHINLMTFCEVRLWSSFRLTAFW